MDLVCSLEKGKVLYTTLSSTYSMLNCALAAINEQNKTAKSNNIYHFLFGLT